MPKKITPLLETIVDYERTIDKLKKKNKALRRKFARTIEKHQRQYAELLKENERLKRELLKEQGAYKKLESMRLEKEQRREVIKDQALKDFEKATKGDRGKPRAIELGEKADNKDSYGNLLSYLEEDVKVNNGRGIYLHYNLHQSAKFKRSFFSHMSKKFPAKVVKEAWDSIYSDSPLDIRNEKSSNDKYKNVTYKWKRPK